MFFPPLIRSPEESYKNILGKFYANYRSNHNQVSIDCKHRCVYCDILVEEMGHEGMQLDHFRPQFHFPDLETDPFNLVLSCPKCNVLKSKDWPAEKEPGKPTFVGKLGYVDAFKTPLSTYMKVEPSGEISSLKDPTPYIIERLLLNRASRCLVRRQRIIKHKKEELLDEVTSLLTSLNERMARRDIDIEDSQKQLEAILSIQKTITSM